MVFVDLDLGEDLVWYSCPGHLMGFLALCHGEGSKELGDGLSCRSDCIWNFWRGNLLICRGCFLLTCTEVDKVFFRLNLFYLGRFTEFDI